MKQTPEAYTEQPWRLHEVADDFVVEDVWSIAAPGSGPEDFPVMLEAIREAGTIARLPAPIRALFAVRWRLGEAFGWDTEDSPIELPEKDSLLDRLPADLRDAPRGTDGGRLSLNVYQLPTEGAQEAIHGVVHSAMHLGWVPGPEGGHELRMTVLLKRNRPLGRAYMAAVAPFRNLFVYPALIRLWESAWRERVVAR